MSKRKRNEGTRKPRIIEVRVDFGGPMTLTGMSAPGEGPLQFFGVDGKPVHPKHVELGTGYERSSAKGLKVINRAAADARDMQRDPTRALMRFASLLAVDTNTRKIGGDRISVAASVFITNLRIEERRWSATRVDQAAYEFHNARISPERLGWRDLLERAIQAALPTPAGVIVDSELALLASMNRCEEEIIPGFQLPRGYELVYSSADAGAAEYLGNAAIRQCDRVASEILERIYNDEAVRRGPWPDPPDGWTDRRRYWLENARVSNSAATD